MPCGQHFLQTQRGLISLELAGSVKFQSLLYDQVKCAVSTLLAQTWEHKSRNALMHSDFITYFNDVDF